MAISTESVQKYAEGLKADLTKAKERKEQASQVLTEAENQIKVLDGALQFSALLIQDSEKNASSEVEGVVTLEGEAEQTSP